MRYFVRNTQIAAAETDRTAVRLIKAGYRECDHAEYVHIWRMRDLVRLARLQAERERQASAPTPRTPEKLPNGMTQFYTS